MYRKVLYLLSIVSVLMISACNLREKLPTLPNPDEYIESSHISVPGDYLIRNQSGDEYVIINEQAISDSIIRIGDEIVFESVVSLPERDSLHTPYNKIVTSAFMLYIVRNSVYHTLTFPEEYQFITIYSKILEKAGRDADTFCLTLSDWFEGYDVNHQNLAEGYLSFHPLKTGLSQLITLHDNPEEISFSAGTGNHYVWMQAAQTSVSYFLPVITDNTSISLNCSAQPDSTTIAKIQGVFPDFFTNSPVFKVNASHPIGTGTLAPIIKYRLVSVTAKFSRQWVVVTANQVFAWAENPQTWLETDGYIYAPCRINGIYMLITPIEEQDELSIPLDAGINQVYVQQYWLDLRNISISGGYVNIETEFNLSPAFNNYFSGNPYSLQATFDKIRIRFLSGNSVISELPNSEWIEIGFCPASVTSGKKLIRYFESPDFDYISYKTQADGYDEAHYSTANGWIYSSVTGSGDFIYGSMSQNDAISEIPVLKTKGEFQLEKAYISWNNTENTSFSSVLIEYLPQIAMNHPWLNGHPYQILDRQAVSRMQFKVSGTLSSKVPTSLYYAYKTPTRKRSPHLILFNDLNEDFTARLLSTASIADIDHFSQANGYIVTYPTLGGLFIHGNVTNLDSPSFDVRMYQNMSLDFDALKIWMRSPNSLSGVNSLSIAVVDDFNDPLNILSTQYDLTQTSPSYTFAISSGKRSSSDFYSEHQPLIYMKRFSRRNEVLFTLAQAVNYRLYAYGLATEPDGWNYAVNGSYNLFYLVHNGQFATFTDNNPHNSITYSVSDSLNDVNLSLYQAQFMLPSYFLSQVTPVGTLITLQNLTDLSSLNSAVSATRLDIRDAQNIALTTNFLTGYLTTSYPLLYVPFPYQYSGQHIRFFFKDISGVVTEYTNVTEFSNYALTEFRIYGNSAICFVNNPGTYYVTVSNRKKSLF